MHLQKYLLLFFLFISFFLSAQERRTLQGRVVSDGDAIGMPAAFVINVKAGLETKTDALGNFTIEAAVGDKLAVYNSKIQVREFVVKEESFKENPFTVSVQITAYELKEIVIQDTINSVALGIVPKNQKKYTHVEKQVFTAMNGVDGLINAITGKTKVMKMALETEKKEMLMEKINYIYTEEELTRDLKIPEEYIRGFVFYVAEDKEFSEALKAKNETMAKFLMQGLAKDYLKALNNE